MARPNNPAAIAGYVQGLREAKAAFQALEPTFREALGNATEMTVREIARNAKAKVQSSPSIQTRALLNAIGWTMNRKNGRGRAGVQSVTTTLVVAGRKVKVKGVIVAGRGGSARTSQGAKKINPRRYAHLVEFGRRGVKAEPFMMPAAEGQKQPYLDRCREAGRVAERQLSNIGSRFQ